MYQGEWGGEIYDKYTLREEGGGRAGVKVVEGRGGKQRESILTQLI